MAADWAELTRLTRGETLVVERVRLTGSGIAVEGAARGGWELPPLAALSAEDQVFVAAFVKAHGSIKEVGRLFGVSYPTVKNRLNRIGAALGFVDVERAGPGGAARAKAGERSEALKRLATGEITVDEAEDILRGSNRDTQD